SHFDRRGIRHIENGRTKAEACDRVGYGCDSGSEIVTHYRKRRHCQGKGVSVETDALLAADEVDRHNGRARIVLNESREDADAGSRAARRRNVLGEYISLSVAGEDERIAFLERAARRNVVERDRRRTF